MGFNSAPGGNTPQAKVETKETKKHPTTKEIVKMIERMKSIFGPTIKVFERYSGEKLESAIQDMAVEAGCLQDYDSYPFIDWNSDDYEKLKKCVIDENFWNSLLEEENKEV